MYFPDPLKAPKPHVPHMSKRPTGELTPCQHRCGHHQGCLYEYHSVMREDLFPSFKICLLHRFSKQHCHVIISVCVSLKLWTSKGGMKYLFFGVSNYRCWCLSIRTHWWTCLQCRETSRTHTVGWSWVRDLEGLHLFTKVKRIITTSGATTGCLALESLAIFLFFAHLFFHYKCVKHLLWLLSSVGWALTTCSCLRHVLWLRFLYLLEETGPQWGLSQTSVC